MFTFIKDTIARNISADTTRQILSYNDDLMVCRLSGKAGDSVAEHKHPHTQISYVISGKVEITIDGTTKILGPGDSALMPPHSPHSAKNLEDTLSLDIFTPMREDFLEK